MEMLKYGDITIRQAEKRDAKQLTAWWNDGAVMAHAGFPNGLGTSEEEVSAGLGNGRLIGEACYRKVADETAEIGIKICEVDFQNRGLGYLVQCLFHKFLSVHFSSLLWRSFCRRMENMQSLQRRKCYGIIKENVI